MYKMSLTYLTANNGKLLIEMWTGEVHLEEIVRRVKERVQDPSLVPGAAVLVYAMGITLETSLGSIHGLADLHHLADSKHLVAKYALVVDENVWERAEVFAKEVASYGINAIVFTSLETACLWVGANVENVRHFFWPKSW